MASLPLTGESLRAHCIANFTFINTIPVNSIIAPYLCISKAAVVSCNSVRLSSYVRLKFHNCSLVASLPSEVPAKEATASQTLSHSRIRRLSRTTDG
nr:hypothetical protein Iba_chr05fCG16090 [Ipomoea batatas]GMD20483.1 hypothetical protein Iba_chr07fCG5300 [Ipomoea batatas]GME09648.1 hypothetical protein Iba_scaffold8947CG0180 [Ipomoea batatas]GME09649.1 hypothetical protein Iba_scaffold8947CG0190 [Ipomoea batatas]